MEAGVDLDGLAEALPSRPRGVGVLLLGLPLPFRRGYPGGGEDPVHRLVGHGDPLILRELLVEMPGIEPRVFAWMEGGGRCPGLRRLPPSPVLPGVAAGGCRGAFGGAPSLELVHVLFRAAGPRGGPPGRKGAFS